MTAGQEERLLSMRTSALGKVVAVSKAESARHERGAANNTFAAAVPPSLSHASGAENVLRAVTSEFALRVWEMQRQRTANAVNKKEEEEGDKQLTPDFGIATPFVRQL